MHRPSDLTSTGHFSASLNVQSMIHLSGVLDLLINDGRVVPRRGRSLVTHGSMDHEALGRWQQSVETFRQQAWSLSDASAWKRNVAARGVAAAGSLLVHTNCV